MSMPADFAAVMPAGRWPFFALYFDYGVRGCCGFSDAILIGHKGAGRLW